MEASELTAKAGVYRVGHLLREVFGIWVGLLDETGQEYPIGVSDSRLDRPICELFKRISIPANRESKTPTCAQSLEEWAELSLSDEPETLHYCHAGFSAYLWSVPDSNLKLYISGFIQSSDANEQVEKLQERLEDESVSDDVDIDLRSDLPILREFQLDVVKSMGEELLAAIDTHLGEGSETETKIEGSFHGIVGKSPVIDQVFETIQQVGPRDSTVLVRGENGTGKELIARAVHRESTRNDKPFLALNCASIPAELIASELFGHKEGAFSGANRDRIGIVEEADGGTLFLDEIAEMEPRLQVKLLRFLQEGTFSPVGSNERRSVDVRILCATNRELETLIEDGKFRKDLYFRLNVVSITAPPLRHRRGDIPVLARHFLHSELSGEEPKKFSDDCIEALKRYDWPGNVRELENEVQRAVIMSGDDERIIPEYLSDSVCETEGEPMFLPDEDLTLPEATKQLEKSMILNKLRQTGWNKSQTARELDVSRRNLIRKVSKLGLEEYKKDDE